MLTSVFKGLSPITPNGVAKDLGSESPQSLQSLNFLSPLVSIAYACVLVLNRNVFAYGCFLYNACSDFLWS